MSPPSAFFVSSPVLGGPRTHKTALQRKKRMIWHCLARNALVARVAEAFAAKDRAALRGLGLKLGEKFLARPSFPHITILVEGIAHAETLDSRLDGWIIAATPHGLDDDAREPAEPTEDPDHEPRAESDHDADVRTQARYRDRCSHPRRAAWGS